MLKEKGKVISCLVVLLFLVSIGAGCQNAARKPTPDSEEPQKNPELSQKYQEEPTISLFIAETGEKKEIKLEEYLQGVVAGEMQPDWPQNALAAQAILARTFTLKKIEDGGVVKRGTDASTDVEEFQAYNPDLINENVQKAVETTRGQVVTYEGELINAWFHADAGGITSASAEEGLDYTEEETPYIKSVKDPGFEITKSENKSWTVEFPLDEVRQNIKERIGQDPGEIQEVQILSKGPSGRINEVQINNTTISGNGLRMALGSKEMRSTLVEEMSVSDGKLIIKGKGYGHGVGMSQWGAKKMAEDGKAPEEILQYFFKDIEIEKIWD